jgi:hypothetical protein
MKLYMAISSTVRCYTDRTWIIAANSEDEARTMVGEPWDPNSFSLAILDVDACDITAPTVVMTTTNRDQL